MDRETFLQILTDAGCIQMWSRTGTQVVTKHEIDRAFPPACAGKERISFETFRGALSILAGYYGGFHSSQLSSNLIEKGGPEKPPVKAPEAPNMSYWAGGPRQGL